jgi:type 1 fimbria pilin
MKMNYKKSLKFITLLLASLLIATVSATVYTQMFLSARVGVAGLSLKWEQGTNANVTCTIVGSTCTLTGLKGYPGQTTKYNDTVKITNAGSSTVTFNITTTQCEGSTSKLTSIYVKIYNSTDSSLLYTLNVWENNDMGNPLANRQIKAGVTWKLGWEITWAGDAGIPDYVDVALRLDVSS